MNPRPLATNRMHRWFLPLLGLSALIALALRAPQLDLRPMHNDENVNAIKVQGLWEGGHYRYDPHEYHGPTLPYATLPALWWRGPPTFAELGEGTLRAVPVFFGVLLVLLVGWLREALGRTAALGAAAFTALSPAMVFYSRYYIHEMLLVCFTMVALVGVWRYGQTRQAAWAAVAGLGFGLMYATKETFVLAVAAMLLGWAATALWARWREHAALAWKSNWNGWHFGLAVGVALAVAALFFTSCFTHWRGLLDSVLTYLPWLSRAGGRTAHVHPWYYYFEHLFFFHQPRGVFWSEGLILLLAAVGWGAGLAGKGVGAASVAWVRFLGFYTLFLSGIYSVLPYKTPWCFLGFYHGMILLAGVGTVVLFNRWPRRPAAVALSFVLLVATAHLGWQAWRASFGEDRMGRLLAADRQNPYVYAQTLPDALELVAKVKGLARIHPDGNRMVIQVMAPGGEYLPLPWYLRGFQQVGWYEEVTADPEAPVLLVGAGLGVDFQEQSQGRYLNGGLFTLRPATYFNLYVQADLWRAYVTGAARSANP